MYILYERRVTKAFSNGPTVQTPWKKVAPFKFKKDAVKYTKSFNRKGKFWRYKIYKDDTA